MRGLFQFNKVDFGLFYSGIIMDDRRQNMFTMVYDCGSKNRSKLKTEIEKFASNVVTCEALLSPFHCSEKPILNLLTISHLHDDHVNGICDLFQRFRVEKVFLPYFPLDVKVYLLSLALLYGPDSYETYRQLWDLYDPESKMDNKP